MPGTAALIRPLPGLLALLLAGMPGCVIPPSPLPVWGARRNAAAIQVLHQDYGLPLAPPCTLDVAWPDRKGPGHFSLRIREPGWQLEAPLESTEVSAQDDPGGTTFTWSLPLTPLGVAQGGPAARPILLHLHRGADHRALVAPCRATRYRGPVPEPGQPYPTLFLDPALRFGGPEGAAPLPGPDAPGTLPAATAPLEIRLDAGDPGGRVLRINFRAPDGTLAPPVDLEAFRRALAVFQPDLAARVRRDPGAPAAFSLPMAGADLERGRPLLLLLRSPVPGERAFALWVFYFPRDGAWAKAFCLLRGPWNEGPA